MLIGVQGQQLAANLSAGGTVKGDLVVEGDFKVEGAGSFAYDEIIEGSFNATSGTIKASSGDTSFIIDSLSGQDASLILKSDAGGANEDWWTFRADNDQKLYIRNGNTDLHAFTSAGLIGIGTTSPSKTLDVEGDIRIRNAIHSFATSNRGFTREWLAFNEGSPTYKTSVDYKFHKFQNNSGTTIMAVGGSDSRIGIGTESPSQLLHIEGSSFPTALIKGGSSGSVLRLQGANNDSVVFNDNTADKWFLRYQPGADKIDFYNAGTSTSALTILDSNNNVGIGTTSPYYITDIRFENTNTSFSGGSYGNWGSNGLRIENSSSTVNTMSTIHFRNYSADIHIASIYNDIADSDLGFFFEGSEKMRFTNDGRFGIGTTSPSSNLHIKDASSYTQLKIESGSVNQQTYLTMEADRPAENDIIANIQFTSAGSLAGDIKYKRGSGDNIGHFLFGTGAGGGTRFVLDNNSRISLGNNDSGGDTTNTVFGYTSGNSIASGGIKNTLFGKSSGYSISTGDSNTNLGWEAGYYNATGSYNTAVGSGSMMGASGQSNSSNTAVGYFSLKAITTGYNNTAIGTNAGDALTTGYSNVLIGKDVLGVADGGEQNNVVIGFNAGSAINHNSTSANVIIGSHAGVGGTGYISRNVIIGDDALVDLNSRNSIYNTIVGSEAGGGTWAGDGTENTVLGYQAFKGAVNGANYNTILGSQAGKSITTGSANTGVGQEVLKAITIGQYNVAIGENTLGAEDVGNFTTAIGYRAGYSQNSDSNNEDTGNTLLGAGAGFYNVTGTKNTLVGRQAGNGASGQSNSNNTAVGYNSLYAVTTGSENTAIGRTTLNSLTTGTRNVTVGMDSGGGTTTGNDNIFIGKNAGAQNVSGDEMVIIGSHAGFSINHATDADGTVAIGFEALKVLTSGASNTSIGYGALKADTTGYRNTALGYQAGNAVVTGALNTYIGNASGKLHTGDNSTYIGDNAGALTTSGSTNVAIGQASDYNNKTGSSNTAIGYQSMLGATDQSHSNNTSVGYKSLYAITTGSNNTALGYNAGLSITTPQNAVAIGSYSNEQNTTGWSNVAIGGEAIRYNQTGENNVAIGRQAMLGVSGNSHSNNTAVGTFALKAITTGSSNVALGYGALQDLADGGSNIGIGYRAGYESTSASNNVYVGLDSGRETTTGGKNIGIGSYALVNVTDTNNMVAIGYNAGSSVNHAGAEGGTFLGYEAGKAVTSGGHNTALGYQALLTNSTSSFNTAIGSQALTVATGAGGTAVGYRALKAITSGASNTAVGYEAGKTITTGQKNIAIGYEAMHDTDAGSTSSDSDNNIFIGYTAGGGAWADAKSENNVAIGSNVMQGVLNGANNNTALGYFALASITSGDTNVGIGSEAGGVLTTSIKNTILGYQAGGLISHVSASDNVLIGNVAGKGGTGELKRCIVIGSQAMDSTTDQAQTGTIAIGYNALTALTTGAGNTAVGYETMSTADGGEEGNAVFGYQAGKSINGSSNYNTIMGYLAGTGGSANMSSCVAIGANALNSTAGNNHNGSVAVGKDALTACTSGEDNTALGYRAGNTITTGAGNLYIGYDADASANDVNDEIVIKAGEGALVGGGTETVRIGVDSDYITNDFGENATWTHSSDKRIKKDIEDSALGLDFINDLRPVIFKKKAPSEYPQEFEQYDANTTERKNPDRKHYGFIAQEVKEAIDKAGHSEFPVWKENRDGMQELGETELITPLIKAVQELSAEVKQLKKQLEDK